MSTIVDWDHRVTDRIRIWGKPWYGVWKFIAAESIYAFIVLAAALVFAGRLVWWQAALVLGSGYLAANLLQRLFRRSRPDYARLTGYHLQLPSYSFPSAHASTSAAAATMLTVMPTFANQTLALVVAGCVVLLALLIGISRMIIGVHYFLDILAGWFLGFVIAWGYVLVF